MGIGAAIIGSAIISGGSSYLSSRKQASASRRAGRVAAAGAAQAREDLAPWRGTGESALGAMAALQGLEGGGAYENGLAQFYESPGYQFRFDEGMRAVDHSAGARGDLFSGRTGRALQDYGQGIASQEYGNYYNRMAQLAGWGQNAAAGQGAASMAGANAQAAGIYGAGVAEAGGIAGVGNAITGGIGNYMFQGAIGQPKQQPQQQQIHQSSYWGR